MNTEWDIKLKSRNCWGGSHNQFSNLCINQISQSKFQISSDFHQCKGQLYHESLIILLLPRQFELLWNDFWIQYSNVSNKRSVWNKRPVWKISATLISVLYGIDVLCGNYFHSIKLFQVVFLQIYILSKWTNCCNE